jgi:hypothetical protein
LRSCRREGFNGDINDDAELEYGVKEHQVDYGEISLILMCFDDGYSVKWVYLEAAFEDKRLPSNERCRLANGCGVPRSGCGLG